MNTFRLLHLSMLVALLISSPAHADIYKCILVDGKTIYQNSPCEIKRLKSQVNLIKEGSNRHVPTNSILQSSQMAGLKSRQDDPTLTVRNQQNVSISATKDYVAPRPIYKPGQEQANKVNKVNGRQQAITLSIHNTAEQFMVGTPALEPAVQGVIAPSKSFDATSTPGFVAWRDCIPNSIGPGGCDSIGPGGGKSIGPGGGLSIGPGGGLSIGPGGGQSIGPGGGQSIAPGGGKALDRDRGRGLNTDTMRSYTQLGMHQLLGPVQSPAPTQRMIVGGPLSGSIMPGPNGGMVTGGPLHGTLMPGANGGMITGGPLHGTMMPSY